MSTKLDNALIASDQWVRKEVSGGDEFCHRCPFNHSIQSNSLSCCPSTHTTLSPIISFKYWRTWLDIMSLWQIFYRTRVRSLVMLVTNSLTHSLTDSVTFSKLDWCDPGEWRYQLKTCWGCYCCSCWCWGSCMQQFVTDLGADVWS